jgi:hypothetical protein
MPAARKRGGRRPATLTAAQQAQVKRLLRRCVPAANSAIEHWTRARVQQPWPRAVERAEALSRARLAQDRPQI